MHQIVWAPWRMDYILTADELPSCIFCFDSEEIDEERLVLFIDSEISVIMNKYPYNGGHLLISPREHTSRLEDLSDGVCVRLTRMVDHAMKIMNKTMAPHGFNIGINVGRVAGAGVEDHLHYHLVPRWNGDTNFMPVVADTKVMPEHIRETYAKLLPYFQGKENR